MGKIVAIQSEPEPEPSSGYPTGVTPKKLSALQQTEIIQKLGKKSLRELAREYDVSKHFTCERCEQVLITVG